MAARTLIFVALPLAVGGAAIAASQETNNWGTARDGFENSPYYAQTKAICRRLGEPRVPVADRPTRSQASALKGCDSEKLYYGIGIRPDYRKARWCAAIEFEGPDGAYGVGAPILMQVYANGLGVKRNPDLATGFACRLGGAAAEMNSRIMTLQSFKQKPGHIDLCDDVTSGLLDGFCTARSARIMAVGRDAKLANLIASFAPAGRSAYPAMKKAFDAYVDASGGGETDLSGTARAAFVVQAEEVLRDQFLIDLQRLKTGRWPTAGAADAGDADARLNASYRKALAWAAGKDNYTTVKADDIRAAQRSWLVYRDAYLRFAAATGASRDAVLARLTRLRLAQLDALVSE